MSLGRRSVDRRRRVLYSTQQADLAGSTAASRRAAEQLREARRPPAVFGSRVHRRIRGRWFSLVPVSLRTLVAIATVLLAIAIALCVGHYASVTWPSIANDAAIARPLRLDQPDSFGRWYQSVLLAASAGAALMIYQLRRYRIDDFTGQYRLWRVMVIAMLLASINSLVSLVDWGGALLDAGLGKRVALSGNDWLRLLLSFGGAVLALRLIVEVRKSTWSLVTMLGALLLASIGVAAQWNVLQVDTLGKWIAVTSAPLLSYTVLFLSLGGYLRMLYRQVRKLPDSESLMVRLQNWRENLARNDSKHDAVSDKSDTPRRAWSPRLARKQPGAAKSTVVDSAGGSAVGDSTTAHSANERTAAATTAKDESSDRPKRRWFGLRAAKTQSQDSQEATANVSRNPPQPTAKTPDEAADIEKGPAESRQVEKEQTEKKGDDKQSPQPKRGLFSFMQRGTGKPNATPSAGDPESRPETEQRDAGQGIARNRPLQRSVHASDELEDDALDDVGSDDVGSDDVGSDDVDWEDVDWESLSKTERRRLRKQLKRQGRTAA